jgi:general secretion pathway protein G
VVFIAEGHGALPRLLKVHPIIHASRPGALVRGPRAGKNPPAAKEYTMRHVANCAAVAILGGLMMCTCVNCASADNPLEAGVVKAPAAPAPAPVKAGPVSAAPVTADPVSATPESPMPETAVAGEVNASPDDPRTLSLNTNLQMVRSQLILYQVQHNNAYPDANFVAQLTRYTDIAGKTSDKASIPFMFGPYMQGMPANPFSGSKDVVVVNDPKAAFHPPAKDGGWWYNSATGEFRANLTRERRAAPSAALGVLKAVLNPKAAADEARLSSLETNLQTIRSQLLLYKTQHNEMYPGADFGLNFTPQLTQYTDFSGKTSAAASPQFPFGPYLQNLPANPFSGSRAVMIVNNPATGFHPPEKDGGWWFNAATGEFRANLTDEHKTQEGQPINGL